MNPTIATTDQNPMNEIVYRFQQGEIEALVPLIQENIRYVVTAAKDYQDKGVSLKDLISAGIRYCRGLYILRQGHRMGEELFGRLSF